MIQTNRVLPVPHMWNLNSTSMYERIWFWLVQGATPETGKKQDNTSTASGQLTQQGCLPFLPHEARQCELCCRKTSVHLSVRMSWSGIVSKWLNISSKCFHHLLA